MGDSSEGSCSRSNNSSAGSRGINIKRGSGLRGCPALVAASPSVEARAGLDPGGAAPEARDGGAPARDGGGGGAARRTESTFGVRLEGGGSDDASGSDAGGSDAGGSDDPDGSDELADGLIKPALPETLERGRGGGPLGGPGSSVAFG